MDESKQRFGRRDFLVGSASLAIAALGASCSDGRAAARDSAAPARDGAVDGAAERTAICAAAPQPLPAVSSPARVVEVHDASAVTDGGYVQTRVKAMLLAGLQELGGASSPAAAWKALLPDFTSSMRIGIKVNCLSTNLASAPELVSALIETLINDLGATRERIWVWDRRTDELTRSGLTAAALKVRVAGTETAIHDASGPGYEQQGVCVLAQQTHLSRILTAETDLCINLALLKTHNVSGITGALKNTYGCIDNPGEFHDDLNHALPALYRVDALRRPFRLHITEALKAVIKGDTTDYPDAIPARLLLARDPVALDAQSLKLVNNLRAANTPALEELPAEKLAWLGEAARLNLGTREIELKTVNLS